MISAPLLFGALQLITTLLPNTEVVGGLGLAGTKAQYI